MYINTLEDLKKVVGQMHDSEFKENEYEESGSNAKNQLNIIDSSMMSNNNNSHSANLINNNASEEFPILDELDRLAKVFISNLKKLLLNIKKNVLIKDVKISFKWTND